MNYFRDYSSKLSKHNEFDPRAFIGDSKVSQELCSFILALALAYNDFKDYNIFDDMLLKSRPDGPMKRDSNWGEHSGINLHLIRLQIGFVHELFQLLQENKRVLEEPFFKEVFRVLPQQARDSWKNLVEAALGADTGSRRSNPLFMIRNKIAFHYATKELLAGYKKGFFLDKKVTENACVSRGNTLRNTRFYFADRAVQGYIEGDLNVNIDSFIRSLAPIMEETNLALYNLCVTFVQRRGFSWKET